MLKSFLGRKFREDLQEHKVVERRWEEQQALIKAGKAVPLSEGEEVMTECPEAPSDYRRNVKNYYDYGVKGNFKQVFFPFSVHDLAPLTPQEEKSVVMPRPKKEKGGG